MNESLATQENKEASLEQKKLDLGLELISSILVGFPKVISKVILKLHVSPCMVYLL